MTHARDSLTAGPGVVDVDIKPSPMTLEYVRKQNAALFRKEQAFARYQRDIQGQIEALQVNINKESRALEDVRSLYLEDALTYKEDNGIPPDVEFDWKTGKAK